MNKESQRLQYALKDKAKEWGWQSIEVMDCDLGSSAAMGSSTRVGFERLTASVAVGEIGIIFSREASRLSRTDKDWCRLLEVCSIFDTLISDGEQIYDCNSMDDQLILGIKGTLSVVELKTIRMRLIAGMQSKAERGEYRRQLPPGYVWDETNKIVKDPNQRIQDAIALIFAKFSELQSIRQTHLWFHSQKVELPVTADRGGHKKIVWKVPAPGYINDILKNPTYAGVYVWGREVTKLEYEDGQIVKKKTTKTDPRESKVFLEDNHEGYISLDRYDQNQELIEKNRLSQTTVERRGAAREGQGLLAGILRCGRCGRKFYVAYYGKSGTAARYLCRGDYHAGGEYCLAFGGSTVDKAFSRQLLDVITPYGMEASIEAAKTLCLKEEETKKALSQKIKQLEYEVSRAFEQYNEVDPRNRLVAAELERRWNVKLEELACAKKDYEKTDKKQCAVTEEEKRKILTFGERFSEVWTSADCPNSVRKRIVRSIIEDVIVNLDDESQMLRFIIHWKGGCHSAIEMPKPPAGIGQKTSEEDLGIIRKMAHRYGDNDIARVLNRLGRRTATGMRWNQSRITNIRSKYSIAGHLYTVEDPNVLTLGQTAKYLNVSRTTVKRLVAAGTLEKEQAVPWAPWEIKKKDLDSVTISQIVKTLRETGKLHVNGDDSGTQIKLFNEI